MKPTELRTNSVVLSRKGVLKEIGLSGLELLKSYELSKYTDRPPYYPVHLTDEVFIQIGFELHEGWDGFEYWIKDNTVIDLLDSGKYQNEYGKEVSTLHQLQNIYFANENKELDLTEYTKLKTTDTVAQVKQA